MKRSIHQILSLLFLVFNSFSEAGVLDHLKPAAGKCNTHKIKNVDFIYVINLDQRPEKFQKTIDQLHPYGIFPYRFSAVNGWELTREEINDLGVSFAPGMIGGYKSTVYPLDSSKPWESEVINHYGQVYFGHCLSQGCIGCILSHLSCIKDAYDSGYNTIWVMEDDIKVIKNPNIIPELIEKLDHRVGEFGWDILFTDRDIRDSEGKYIPSEGMAKRPNYNPKDKRRFYVKQDIDSTFRKIGSRFGAHSMIIRRSGMQKLLNFYEQYQLYHPYDIDYYLPEGINIFTVREDVVGNIPGGISDSKRPGYLKNKSL